MNALDRLESQSIHILREAHHHFARLGMLWSIGKDSTVLLWLARKAFFGKVPFPLIHIDTSFKIPEMIEHRDRLAREWGLKLIVGRNDEAISSRQTFPDGAIGRLDCCRVLKTEALRRTIQGQGPRSVLNLETGRLEDDPSREAFQAVFLGIRADEEGTRAKERVFSARDPKNAWRIAEAAPELWNQFNTEFAPGMHVRVHPILEWTELDVWNYIRREDIPTIALYRDQGAGKRYRSLGCAPCTAPIASTARSLDQIVAELDTGLLAGVAERAGRAQDRDDAGGGLEMLRKDGYM